MDSGLRYLEFHLVSYGVVPENFHVVAGPEALSADQFYQFSPTFHGLGRDAYFELYLDTPGRKAIRTLSEDQFLAIIHDTPGH
jgi:hypothetical protein